MATDCTLCQRLLSAEAIPGHELVWEFAHSVAFLGPWQYYQGYCVLVARRHATELSQLQDGERRAYLDEMCRLARAIETSFRPDKLNYELLGNQVGHLHWHLFPRYASDPDRLRPVWFAIDRAERDDAERRKLRTGSLDRWGTVEMLRKHLELERTS
jgi:diadenosine tetraphosphate (Ap4A) HIT family hydrolase